MKFSFRTASKEILSDLITPVGAYMRVRDDYPQSALMECSDYHGGENARSYIALHPIASISVAHGVAVACYPDGTEERHTISSDFSVADALNDFIGNFQITGEDAHQCEMFGYTSFNCVRYFEHIAVKDETREQDDAPDMIYVLFKDFVIFDHFHERLRLVELLQEGERDDLDQLEHDLLERPVKAFPFRAIGEPTSTLTDEEHKANIRRGIRHCKRGDVFQIVLSRRFVQRFEGDDLRLYRALRSVNPSPYLFYFDLGGLHIFGSSPETHCRIEGRKAYIDPIAGTTRRTGNAEQDRKNALYLKNDPKENAEHVMLVDLARNDLSRNCHDVKVDFYKDMQYYSHVIHLVSRVSGTLNEGADPIKAFIDTFPAGTLSGAPKVRAMQLISEYEPHNRGAYGGCIGSIGMDGSVNQAITIRTFVSRGGELWFQAGGGIVAKSNEEYELQEVNNKLGALRRAILLADNNQ